MDAPHRSTVFATLVLLIGLTLGAGQPAEAATVTGTFQYRDTATPACPTPAAIGCVPTQPIAFARVEILHRGIFPWNGWATVGAAFTDSAGFFTFSDGRGDGTYAVRVFAANYAARVFPDGPNNEYMGPFFAEPGQPGAAITHAVGSTGQVVDFSFTFADVAIAEHYNIAETIRLGFDYATARRDPGGADPLVPATVTPTSFTGNPANVSWYNPIVHQVIIHSADMFDDLLLLHEYAHWLEAQLSSFAWIASYHDGCTARDGLGNVSNSPEHAWMEAFAGYFAQSVARLLPAGTLAGGAGTPPVSTLEAPAACTASAADAVENFVAATLWDLFDAPADPGAVNEPHDVVARADLAIFQIFDRELDVWGRSPTIWDFRNAWLARGLDRAGLDRILSRYGILPSQLAQFVVQSVPSQMTAGQTVQVSVTMRNIGITTWVPGSLHRLGSQGPQDNTRWGIHRAPLPAAVAPGQQVTFAFTITAPATAGNHLFRWRMVQDAVEWFGDFTPSTVVTVTAPDQPELCFDPELRKWIPC